MKIAIGIPTYQRLDGTTPKYLNRAFDSILNQTHQDYKVFLIGDKYENENEFEMLGHQISKEKIYRKNLSFAKEREKYKMDSRELWCSGGANAYNTAIDICLDQGYSYMCHLDHDDYWANDHLEQIVRVIDLVKENIGCVYTCSQYKENVHLPRVELTNKIYESFPTPIQVNHSSVCINHELVSLKYRDVFAEEGYALEGDIDMWQRLKPYCIDKKLKSYLIAKLTCFHLNEKQ
jgi:glycosyltransferase involved in cell wall biosynthesis